MDTLTVALDIADQDPLTNHKIFPKFVITAYDGRRTLGQLGDNNSNKKPKQNPKLQETKQWDNPLMGQFHA